MTRFRALLAAASLAAIAATSAAELPEAAREKLARENTALQAEIARMQLENANFRRQLAASSALLLGANATPPAAPAANATEPTVAAPTPAPAQEPQLTVAAPTLAPTPAPVPAPPPAPHATRVLRHHYDTVLGLIGGKVAAFLRDSSYQSMIAIVVFFVGLLSILDAVVFTRCFSVGMAAVAVGMLANSEADAAWQGVLGDGEMWIVGIEAGAITAAAAYVGFAGFQLFAGACLALGSAHLAARWAMIYAWQPEMIFYFFALSAALGVAAMRVGDKTACAILGPATGGLLVASGAIYLLYDLTNITANASPPWVDFADALLTGAGASNVFGGDSSFNVVRTVSSGLGLAVFALGFSRYYCKWPSFGFYDEDSERVQHLPIGGYKEPLAQPLAPPRIVAPAKYNDYAPRPGLGAGGPPAPPPPFRPGRG